MAQIATLFDDIEQAISHVATQLEEGDYSNLPGLMQQFNEFSEKVAASPRQEVKPHIDRLTNIREQLDTLLAIMQQQRDMLKKEMGDLTSSGNAAKAYAKSHGSMPKPKMDS